ncbi:MAG: NADH-quinone oxidoreductase subunit C [Acidobacteria bacterium]|nr:NADH-quinone oxidoreductase subunit C [Acidobacteriota bacterium]MBI1983463.1 NADH-quinone oxidoreductase subunit C [Acidobacteriota bacterium]
MPTHSEFNSTLERLREFDSAAVEETQVFRGELTLRIRADRLRRVCEFLRDAPGLSFKYLSDVTAVDHFPNEPRFEVVYHLLSLESMRRLRLKAQLSQEDPKVESVVPVWPGANAFEREVFDLFGIRFEGHPFLRRILMPEDWEGHPLRKDYPTEGFR